MKLNPQDYAILHQIASAAAQGLPCPTLRELAANTGRTMSAVRHSILKLIRHQLLLHPYRRSRTYTIPLENQTCYEARTYYLIRRG